MPLPDHYTRLPPDHPDLTAAMKKAVVDRDAPILHALLLHGTDVEPEMRGMRWNRLVLAAEHNLGDVVEHLHRAGGIDPYYYHEALHTAAGAGHKALVYQILDYGFDATSTKDFDIALSAVLSGNIPLLEEFASKGFTTDLTCNVYMEGVIEENHAPMLDYMLARGADFDNAFRLMLKCAQRDNMPYDDINRVLEKWSERTVVAPDAHYKPQSMDDLRRGLPHENGFLHLAKANRVADIVDIMRRDKQTPVIAADLTAIDINGNNTLDILGARGQLDALFAPDLWQNKLQDALHLSQLAVPVYRTQINTAGLVAAAHQQNLRAAAPRLTLKPKKGT